MSDILSDSTPIEHKPELISGSFRPVDSLVKIEITPDEVSRIMQFFKLPENDQSQSCDSVGGAIDNSPQTPNGIDYLAEKNHPRMRDLKFSKVIRETRTIQLHEPKPEN